MNKNIFVIFEKTQHNLDEEMLRVDSAVDTLQEAWNKIEKLYYKFFKNNSDITVYNVKIRNGIVTILYGRPAIRRYRIVQKNICFIETTLKSED